MNPELKSALTSYAKIFTAAIIACYLAGMRDPSVLIDAGLASTLPVIYNALTTADKRYGRK
jgi:hypothetical protein